MTEFYPGNIPDELKERDQWLLWDDSHDTPRQPHWRGNFSISWSDPDDWHTFEEAVEQASRVDSWGIGYVMALDNDDHARGLYGCLDLDGCLDDDGQPKDWVPDLTRFGDDGAYVEKSPSGTGLHIPLVGQQTPEWWTDSHFSDDEHEGVEYLTHKFCTFTGDVIKINNEPTHGVADTNPAPFLFESYKVLNGESPRVGTEESDDSHNDREWTQDDVEGLLEHVSSSCSYPQWRNILFAIHDWDDGATGQSVAEDWSRGSGWDSDSQRYIKSIWNGAEQGNGITLGTLVYHAKQGGWSPSGGEKPKSSAQEAAEGSESEDATEEETTDEDGESGPTLRQRVASRVLRPVDPPEDSDIKKIDDETARDRLTDILEDEYSFLRPRADTRGWRDTLYVYSEEAGIYEPHGESFIQRETERVCGAWATNGRVHEIVKKIERRARVSSRELHTAPERLVVGNGILDLTTGEVDDHTPEEYHKTHIPVDYDPDAECPRIDDFLHDVVDDSDVEMLYQLIAHSLYGEYAAEKAAMLLGDGQNGKSVFLSLVERFLGQWNVSNQSLQALNEDEWAPANLVGKLANVHPDMSDQTVETMQEFKKLTGRDTVSANVKFESPVHFENHATLIFACNRMPVLDDDTRGNWRRWILIDFPNTFERGDDDYIEKPQLMKELTQEAELQGLLNRCVEEIKRWSEGDAWFPNAPSWREARRQIRRAAEPVYDFAHACLENTDDGTVPTDDVRQAYQQYASEEGLPGMSREVLGRKLLNQTDYTIEKKRLRDNGARVQVYEGITLTSRGQQLLEADRDDVDGDTKQSQVTDPERNAQRLVQLLQQHEDGESTSQEFLLGLAAADGMTRSEAEHALEKARNRGSVIGDSDSGYVPSP